MKTLYAAFDLHSSNNYLAVIDEEGKRILSKKLPNDPARILATLRPHTKEIAGIVVESTYNWYWLVDMLMAEGYEMHLANPSAIQKYKGLKHADDRDDAFWLAEMLRLGILPEGYIYPQQQRAVRDLLRKRGHLVRLRTSLIISLQHIVTRNCGIKVSVNDVKRLREDRVSPLLENNEDILLAGSISKETINYLTRQIRIVENAIEGKIKLSSPYVPVCAPSGYSRRGEDTRVDDHAGDRSHQSFSEGRQLCVVLPEGRLGMGEQREEKGQRQQEERQQVSRVGIFGGLGTFPTLR